MSTAIKPAIAVSNLRKVYMVRRGWLRRRTEPELALDGINLEINRGELFGLLGPNGAGKTTTVKILATLLLPTSGEASVLGYDVVRDTQRVRESIGFVFGGDRGLYWRLSGVDNLRYFADLYKLPPSVSRRRIPELLEMFGLGGRGNDKVERYSKGMKQRLLLARGLLHDPDVLFLDEPTLGLDPVGARELRELVRSLADNGKTILLTTHYMFEADQICDRIAVIKKGQIVAEGAPESLKRDVAEAGVVELEVPGIERRTLEDMRQLPGVVSVTIQERELSQVVTLHCSDPAATAARLGEMFGGDSVQNVHVREATLEDAYVRLVS